MEEIELNKEQDYLAKTLEEIDNQAIYKSKQIEELENEMSELTHHFSEEYYFLDDEETVTGGDELDDCERVINQVKNQYFRLKKQRLSPYFGKITFKANDENNANDYYIGTFNLTNGNNLPLVCDWRAPVSTMYYDFELGEAGYVAPVGEIIGEISAKRQFKIKDSIMELCFDSSLTIGDDILQTELAHNASDKMKNIVSTIQKEQNKIIREDSPVLFVQGIAGSGKTSIALHRVAYLLYKFREKYSSDDILIISPNSIFSEYISNVLPSLGEENILQTSFFAIAENELSSLVPKLQTREEALNKLAKDPKRLNEVAYKNCFDFCDSLKLYLKTYINLCFNVQDLTFGNIKITKSELEELYNKKYIQKSPATRIGWIADYIIDKLDVKRNTEELYDRVKKVIYPMFISDSLIEIYSDFLDKIGMQFTLDNGMVRNEDIAPLMYIKNYILGSTKQSKVKYLVIDEMQDYSPIHFELFNELYDCEKTVLGDIYQCIEKIIEEKDLEKYANILGAKEILTLNKTYRSTFEITEFSDKIKGLNSNKVDRHGEAPQVLKCENIFDEANKITQLVNQNLNYNSIAIVCKTQEDAEKYYSYLGELEDLKLMSENSTMSKIMIMSASLCKGLEFDMVILPDVSDCNYNNFLDKNLLYVSCTRALHKLFLTTNNDVTKFIK